MSVQITIPFLPKKHLFFGKKSYGFGGYPPFTDKKKELRIRGVPHPFTDKICKVVFDVAPKRVMFKIV